jgi:uncharacterized protein (DUF952 family)
MARYVLHITRRVAWSAAVKQGAYTGDTLATEGFIHCSTIDQVVWVANQRFRGETDLVLLVIDVQRVGAEIKYEAAEAQQLFPHIYGALNIDAVVRIVDFRPDEQGLFAMPEAADPR